MPTMTTNKLWRNRRRRRKRRWNHRCYALVHCPPSYRPHSTLYKHKCCNESIKNMVRGVDLLFILFPVLSLFFCFCCQFVFGMNLNFYTYTDKRKRPSTIVGSDDSSEKETGFLPVVGVTPSLRQKPSQTRLMCVCESMNAVQTSYIRIERQHFLLFMLGNRNERKKSLSFFPGFYSLLLYTAKL